MMLKSGWRANLIANSEQVGYARSKLPRTQGVSEGDAVGEGHGRTHVGDYLHHLSIARGSLLELEVLFNIAAQLEYCSAEDLSILTELCDGISRMLTMLKRALRSKRQ